MSNYKIKELPIMERPRERAIHEGIDHLTNVELLSIIIKNGLPQKNVKEIALDLLKEYPLEQMSELSIEELKKIPGIGEVKAIELLSAIELGKRIFFHSNHPLKKLDSANMIWKDSLYLFYGKKQECFYCYYFNNKQMLLYRKLLFIGTINSSVTHVREVFKEAYRVGAVFIVCLHNHPSGDVTPSQADILFTNHLVETGKIQGIPIVDHIIVSESQYFSFYEKQFIKNEI